MSNYFSIRKEINAELVYILGTVMDNFGENNIGVYYRVLGTGVPKTHFQVSSNWHCCRRVKAGDCYYVKMKTYDRTPPEIIDVVHPIDKDLLRYLSWGYSLAMAGWNGMR